MKLQNQIFVLPSEKAAERKRREGFAKSKESVWVGETVFALPHFLRELAQPQRAILKRVTQKHLLSFCLSKAPLRYFDRLKKFPSLARPFLDAIRQLKLFCISPEALAELLKESGSLKEYDLQLIYRGYEKLKEQLNLLDEEDLYEAAVQKLTKDVWLKPMRSLIIENFLDSPPALSNLLKKIKKTYPALAIQTLAIPPRAASKLKQVQLFSLPTPWQETNWFLYQLQKLLKQNIPLHEIGILYSGETNYYEAIWQKLKNLELVQDPSPFLAWRATNLGRKVLAEAAKLSFREATLDEWIQALLPLLKPWEELAKLFEGLRFHDTLLPLGKVNQPDWLAWVAEALEEKPSRRTPEMLSGLQWLDGNEGDFPKIKFLWVPGLVEGQFPSLSPLSFFQDKRDRSQKAWRQLCEAFAEPQTVFTKKQKTFHYFLAQAETAWLTTPRLDSFGQDVAASAFTWDFAATQVIPSVPPPWLAEAEALRSQENLKLTFGIETERRLDRLQTKSFHAWLEEKKWQEKVAPTQPQHIFSPSQLETYAQCPFKYYSNRVLGIPQQKEYAPELDPDDRGTLFHECLETFLKENVGLYLQARSEEEKEPILWQKLTETVNAVFQRRSLELVHAHPELYEQLKQKTLAQAKKYLSKELAGARNLEAPLQPEYFEWGFGEKLENALKLENTYLGGRVDRIDRDASAKRFLVIDYKTGSIGKYQEKRLKGLALQLPLYILAVRTLLLPESQAIGGLLVATRTGDKKTGVVDSHFNETHYFLHKKSGSLLSQDEFELAMNEVVDWVKTYVEQIRQGYFSPQPKDCKMSCDYKEICRYAGKPFV